MKRPSRFRVSSTHGTDILVPLLFLFFGLGVFIAILRNIGERYARSFPLQIESLFQQWAHRNLDLPSSPVPPYLNESLQIMLNQLHQPVWNSYPISISVEILCHPVPNAFAHAGAKIYVTHSTLELVQNQEDLYLILGHELGHFLNRDHAAGLSRILVSSFSQAFLPLALTDMMNLSFQVKELQLSQTQELKADAKALVLLQNLKINPSLSRAFLEKMDHSIKKAMEGRSQTVLSSLFSTHPPLKARLDRFQRGVSPQTSFASLPPWNFDKKALRQACLPKPPTMATP